jgi:hypothetical protein
MNDINSFKSCKENGINNERIMLEDGIFYIKKPNTQNVWIQLQQLTYYEPIIKNLSDTLSVIKEVSHN